MAYPAEAVGEDGSTEPSTVGGGLCQMRAVTPIVAVDWDTFFDLPGRKYTNERQDPLPS